MAELSVRTEPTPNPNSMKFTLNRAVAAARSETYSSPEQAFLSPLARALFQVPGVAGVFLLKDFVTIKREPDADWDSICTLVQAVLRSHFGATA